MPASPVVMIGPPKRLDGLRERAGVDGEVLIFEDTATLEALKVIADRRPSLVVLERFFAATPRGAALINRIKQDPRLAGAEIRVIAHDSDHSRTISREPPADGGPSPDRPVLDYSGTRRAKRFKIRQGAELFVDGHRASIIDMSRIGAQVTLARPLRPYQRVRIVLGADADTYRCTAAVAWSRYELPRGKAGGHYRVGLELNNPDVERVEAFCVKNEAL